MRILFAALATAGLAAPTASAAPLEAMVQLRLQGQSIEGMPLAWDARKVHLLSRDGRLWEFAPNEAAEFRQTANRFRCYSPSEFRAALLRELGGQFEVSGTGHYLVAHPRGQRDRWAQRFEDLYRSFVHYFSVRGLRPQTPPFPLVGIVCRNRQQFDQYSASQGLPAASGVLGFYALKSNRISLYDRGDAGESDAWQKTASVILHEATHQVAFNTGLHNRHAPPPLWVAEGLATLFEAPGVYDSRHHTQRSDRINRGRFRDFRQAVAPNHKPELLQSIVASDQLFRASPGAAYAEAWALTFFLVETQPRKYSDYLARTAARPPFTDYTTDERVADFTTVFGDDWRMLEARFLRFMAGLK